MNITEWKIDPNVWCLECVHFPVVFYFHDQVDGTGNFPIFNGFSSLKLCMVCIEKRERTPRDQEEFLCEKPLGAE